MTRRADDRQFLTEGEIAMRVGVSSPDWQAAAYILEKSGLPGRTLSLANRATGPPCAHFWTAVPGWRRLSPR
jgi:hypothetical protein